MATLQHELPGVPHVESPFFERLFPTATMDTRLLATATSLHRDGYAIIDFPDPELGSRISRIIGRLGARGPRVQDAWRDDDDVKAIATNRALLGLSPRPSCPVSS
jgi:hypothetical protein